MKIARNLRTTASRAWWADVLAVAKRVRRWPAWRRAGINVVDRRVG